MVITEILSADDWSGIALGDLTKEKFNSMFNDTRSLRSDNTNTIVDHDGYRCLAHFYEEGTYGPVCGMNEWRNLPSAGLDEVWIGLDFKFQEGFIYPLSGKFFGVACGTFGEGGGFATGGNGPASAMLAADKGGSIRMGPYKANSGSPLVFKFYVYDYDMTGKYGRDMGAGQFGLIVPGQWHRMICRFVMNTDGLANGIAQIWFDGVLIGSTNKIKWTIPGITAQKFKIIALQSFTGGGSSTWNSVQDQYMYQRSMFIWYTDNPKGQALYTASESIETPMGYINGPPTEEVPQGVTTITSVTVGQTTAEVYYSYNDTDFTGYEYRIDGGAPIFDAESPRYLNSLTPNTEYDVEVRAINSIGAGAWSALVSFTTAPLPYAEPPQGVVTISDIHVGQTTATIVYSYPDSDASGYQYRLNGGSATYASLPLSLTGLPNGTTYTIEIRAINDAGSGDWSSVSEFTTLEPGEAPFPTTLGKLKTKLKFPEA